MGMGIFKALVSWILMAASGWAVGPYAIPAEGAGPFRRDRLPLDVETMTELSKTLVLNAGFFDTSTAEGRRAVVQALALAVALDPLYHPTREILERLPETGEVPKPQREKPDLAFFLEVENWLRSETAGWEAQRLAICLMDIRRMLDPEDASDKDGVSASAWHGWVPEMAAFEAPKGSLSSTAELRESTSGKKGAQILTPLWILKRSRGLMSLAPVKMRIGVQKPGFSGQSSPFGVAFQGGREATAQPVLQEVSKAVEGLGTPLPLGGRMTVIPEQYTGEPDLAAISGAIAVLMDAVVSRREPEGIVVGSVGADGTFRIPPRAWERLRSIPQDSREIRRLVVPRDMVPLLTGLLVLQGPDFFANYEVVVADSLKDLVERSDKGAAGALGEASARFRQLMIQKGETPADRFIRDPEVRRKLLEISQICPDLVSVGFLELQASGKKPMTVPGVVLGGEMMIAFKPVDELLSSSPHTIFYADFEKVLEQCRSAITSLAKMAEVKDRDLHGQALEVLNGLRTLPRPRRNTSSFERALKAVHSQYSQFHHDVAELAGEDSSMRWGLPTESTQEQE